MATSQKTWNGCSATEDVLLTSDYVCKFSLPELKPEPLMWLKLGVDSVDEFL